MAGDLEKMHARFMRESIDKTAAQLRDLADRVERSGMKVDRIGEPGIPEYIGVALEAAHEISWTMPNLSVERVIREASEADVARATGE